MIHFSICEIVPPIRHCAGVAALALRAIPPHNGGGRLVSGTVGQVPVDDAHRPEDHVEHEEDQGLQPHAQGVPVHPELSLVAYLHICPLVPRVQK